MKTLLLSTAISALLATSFGPAALAIDVAGSSGVELERGGYFVGSVLATDDELSNISDALIDPDSYRFDGKSEVRFEGVSILDNGLRYGFRANIAVRDDLAARPYGDDEHRLVDEAFVFVDGGFGRVEIGEQDGVAGQFSIGSPHALPNLSAMASRGAELADPLGLSAIGSASDTSDDLPKISYVTPSFGGLKLGLSFTPDAVRGARGFDLNDTARLAETGTPEDIVEFGVIYSRDFKDVSLDMSATWIQADSSPVISDQEEWNAGVNVGFRGLTVGGSYREGESANPVLNLQSYEAYDVGVAYEAGSWKVSAQFAEHEGAQGSEAYENGYRYLISARYKVAKGLRVGAGFQHDMDALSEEQGTALILESALKF